MTHQRISPVMAKLRALAFIVSSAYFTTVNFVIWIISHFIPKRSVPPIQDQLILISATEAAERIRTKKLTSVELIEAYIKRIEQVDSLINAVAERNYEDARKKAQEADSVLENVKQGSEEFEKLVASKPLLGVPFTVKDCIEVEGMHCTMGLSSRRDIQATEDAVVIRRMKDAGAILLAITNVPEVCMWWESVNPIYGRVSNPYDSRRIAGGSSGGEGALLSAGGSVIGIGSDIGGSIRMPSYFNGVFGLKPTPGAVPLDGHMPKVEGYQHEMLSIGPMCRYAEDLPLVFNVLSGDYATESLRLDSPVNLNKLRIFYMSGLKSPLIDALTHECEDALTMAVKHFESKYDTCAIRLDLPLVHEAVDIYFASMDVEGEPPAIHKWTNLGGDLDCLKEVVKFTRGKSQHSFPAICTAIFENHPLITEERKQHIVSLRERLQRELTELLQNDAILIFPSFPTLAPFHNQPMLTPFNFIYTGLWNTLLFPVAQCPMGISDKATSPRGVQLVAAPNEERLLIAAARDLEQSLGGWKQTAE